MQIRSGKRLHLASDKVIVRTTAPSPVNAIIYNGSSFLIFFIIQITLILILIAAYSHV